MNLNLNNPQHDPNVASPENPSQVKASDIIHNPSPAWDKFGIELDQGALTKPIGSVLAIFKMKPNSIVHHKDYTSYEWDLFWGADPRKNPCDIVLFSDRSGIVRAENHLKSCTSSLANARNDRK